MYALTCPACNDVRHVSFVRAGAVTRCSACGNQWAIKDRHVERQERRSAPRPNVSEQPPKREALGADQLEDDPKGGSSMTGLSGLSDLMQDVPKPPSAPTPAPPSPAPARKSGGGASLAAAAVAAGSTAAPAPAKASAALSMQARAGIGVAAAVVLGLLVWAVLGGGGDTPSPEAGDTSGPSSAAAPAGGEAHGEADPAAIDPVGPPTPDEDGPPLPSNP